LALHACSTLWLTSVWPICHSGGIGRDGRIHRSMSEPRFGSAKPPCAVLSVFRRDRVGTLAQVVIFPPARQEFSDTQILARQGFDRKLSIC
jgi:hypothetical protein